MTSGGNATATGSSSGAWYSVRVVTLRFRGARPAVEGVEVVERQGLRELPRPVGAEVEVDGGVAVAHPGVVADHGRRG